MLRKIIIFTVILLIIATVAFYVIDVTVYDNDIAKNLPRMLVILGSEIICLVRLLFGSGRRRNLAFYESEYAREIEGAFKDEYMNKKKLLCAIRLYNEDKLEKAAKYLISLKPLCKTREDVKAVGLFLALVLTDMGLGADAVTVYEQMIQMNAVSSTVYSNLGNLYSGLGNYDRAIANMHLAIQNDEENPYAYHNLAKLYFDNFDFDNAERYALIAMEKNRKLQPAANLLAIIYAIKNDEENSAKYSHIAVCSGTDPQKLKRAIERYRAVPKKKECETPETEDEAQGEQPEDSDEPLI